MFYQNHRSGISEHLTQIKPYALPTFGSNWYMTRDTRFLHNQHFYKQHRAEIGE